MMTGNMSDGTFSDVVARCLRDGRRQLHGSELVVHPQCINDLMLIVYN